MGADQNFDFAAATASALEWWRDAGVDVLVEDYPRDWLTAPVPAAPAAPMPSPPASSATVTMPTTLAAFVEWRGGVDMPEAAWAGASIAASGPDIVDMMILADCPDRDDQGTLLSGGAPGRLFGRMLAALGLTRDDVHIAAICWRRPTAGRIPREIEARLGDMTRHHIGLVAPRRLLLLGDGAVRAVLGTHLAEARGRLHFVNHIGGRVAVVASHHPRFLIEKPACKAESWSDLRMLMRDHAHVETRGE